MAKNILITADSRLNVSLQNKGVSQRGEKCIITALLCLIPSRKRKEKWFVELGAGNGVGMSNTRFLANAGWSGVYIEGDKKKFTKLLRNTRNMNVKCHQSYVNCEKGNCLGEILDSYHVPHDFDVLSLDIDGNDYWVWKSLRHCPRIAVIEFNENYPVGESKAIEYDPNFRCEGMLHGDFDDYYGATQLAMGRLGKQKGYRLVAALQQNLFFVYGKVAGDIAELPVGNIPFRRNRPKSSRRMIEVE